MIPEKSTEVRTKWKSPWESCLVFIRQLVGVCLSSLQYLAISLALPLASCKGKGWACSINSKVKQTTLSDIPYISSRVGKTLLKGKKRPLDLDAATWDKKKCQQDPIYIYKGLILPARKNQKWLQQKDVARQSSQISLCFSSIEISLIHS